MERSHTQIPNQATTTLFLLHNELEKYGHYHRISLHERNAHHARQI